MSIEPFVLIPSALTRVATGGVAVTAVFGPFLGGIITNPYTAEDQGIDEVEVLWIDLVQTATPGTNTTSYPLQPGQSYNLPKGDTRSVSVWAATSGHRFSAVVLQYPTPFPPAPQPGNFPPSEPTSLTATLPSYLYVQYNDDANLQAWVRAYNTLAQEAVNWFNDTPLPIYTSTAISGSLLDWVGLGLYDTPRPALSSGQNRNVGPLNTYAFNEITYNTLRTIGPQDIAVTTDDVYKRIITWGFYKGDGKVINVRWLKRRIMRFLNGLNGTSFNVDQTYQISVTFGVNRQVNIRLLNGQRNVTGGAFYNGFALNEMPYNQLDSYFTNFTLLANAQIFKEAVDSSVLELPFQFDYVVSI